MLDTDRQKTAARNAQIVAALVDSRTAALSQLFASDPSGPPQILWDPGRESLTHPLLRRLPDLVAGWRNPDGTLDGSKFDPVELNDLRDWYTLFEDRFLHVGRGVSGFIGADLTGLGLDSLPPTAQHYYSCLHKAIAQLRLPVLNIHRTRESGFPYLWRSLIYPVCAGPSSAEQPAPVIRFLSIAIPDSELGPGLEALPDPALILDHTLRVCVANRAAREMFDNARFGPWDRPLADYAGFDLDLDLCPEALVRQGRVLTRQVRLVVHHLLFYLEASISGVEFDGRYYYSLISRPSP